MRLLSKLVFILSETVGTALPSLFEVNMYFTLPLHWEYNTISKFVEENNWYHIKQGINAIYIRKYIIDKCDNMKI